MPEAEAGPRKPRLGWIPTPAFLIHPTSTVFETRYVGSIDASGAFFAIGPLSAYPLLRGAAMLKQFPPPRDYMGLTLRDLLEARDVYHVHLAHLSNVVGTAIGRYLIREDDWYASHLGSVPTWPPALA